MFYTDELINTPEKCDYLGKEEKYFLGSNKVGAGTKGADGIWNFLIGPGYTSPNFIRREEVFIEIDKKRYLLDFKMKRAKGTGSFVAEEKIGDIDIKVLDFTNRGANFVSRLISVKNNSKTNIKITIKAAVIPQNEKASIIDKRYLSILTDTNDKVFSNNQYGPYSTYERKAIIGFDTSAKAYKSKDNKYYIDTDMIEIKPGKCANISLHHFMYKADEYSKDMLDFFNKLNPKKEYEKSVDEWREWLSLSKYKKTGNEQLDKIIESMLVVIKSCQSYDGAFMACPQTYSTSYLRDSHGGLRGLSACGYTKELKDFIIWVDKRYHECGHIPNGAEIGNESPYIFDLELPLENLGSESTAYYVLLHRYYQQNTNSWELSIQLEESLKYAVDVQIHYAKQNNLRLRFHGDETERYVPSVDGDVYGSLPEWEIVKFSLSSHVSAIASLQYYIKYMKYKNDKEQIKYYEEMLEKFKDALDKYFWDDERKIHNWCMHLGKVRPNHLATNFNLMPMWLGARLNDRKEIDNVKQMMQYVKPKSGFLPIAPGVNEGFSGHTLGYLLYDLSILGDERNKKVIDTLVNKLVGSFGSCCEFYGPKGTGNTHNMNIFSTGINLDAIITYIKNK